MFRSNANILPGLILILIIPLVSCSSAGDPAVNFRAVPFDMEDVKLSDGPFLKATRLNEQILLDYEPDRFLAKFRLEAGLEPRAEHYHGWEDNTIAGHSLGHYLTAICLMFTSTGNEIFRERAIYITDELECCQEADGEGYIGAFPRGKEILEEEVAKGIIKAKGFDLNGIWVPYYTQHKVMNGLNQVYRTFGYRKALEVNIRFADWLSGIVSPLTEEQVQEMLHCEHGGINESLAELYHLTGKEKYLELSRIFQHRAILDPLTAGQDILAGLHANTQIPKFVGLARRYELTGDENDRTGAENFWEMMAFHHSSAGAGIRRSWIFTSVPSLITSVHPSTPNPGRSSIISLWIWGEPRYIRIPLISRAAWEQAWKAIPSTVRIFTITMIRNSMPCSSYLPG